MQARLTVDPCLLLGAAQAPSVVFFTDKMGLVLYL